MTIALWILGGLIAGLVLVGIAELLKGPKGHMTQEEKWWSIDRE